MRKLKTMSGLPAFPFLGLLLFGNYLCFRMFSDSNIQPIQLSDVNNLKIWFYGRIRKNIKQHSVRTRLKNLEQ